jgi:hypothetical protein
MGAHPQKILNENLLRDADILVGIFGTRIGTATTDFISGSVEEIKKHVAAGKLAMLYFSHVPVDPNSIDPNQWAALQAFKDECRTGGLYAEYASHEELRTDFGHHLTIELNKAQYRWLRKPEETVEPREPGLGDDEKRLLIAAASDRNGQVLTVTDMGGFHVQANGESFVDGSPRSVATWKRTLKRLAAIGYLNRVSEQISELTEQGFFRADKEVAAAPLELSLSFSGPPNNQVLSVVSTKPITPKRIDFLMSSEAQIASMELDAQPVSTTAIQLDQKKLGELFNAPRADRDRNDFSGPALLRLSFATSGRRTEVLLPVFLQPKMVGNTQWIQLAGSKTFTVT